MFKRAECFYKCLEVVKEELNSHCPQVYIVNFLLTCCYARFLLCSSIDLTSGDAYWGIATVLLRFKLWGIMHVSFDSHHKHPQGDVGEGVVVPSSSVFNLPFQCNTCIIILNHARHCQPCFTIFPGSVRNFNHIPLAGFDVIGFP